MTDIILGIIIFIAVVIIVRKKWKDKKAGKTGCCSGCSGCSSRGNCHKGQEKEQ